MDKNMIKKLIHRAMALMAISVMLVACRQDEFAESPITVKDGYVALRFSTDIPGMKEVATRAVDPDGGGVQDMTLFCFDRYGLFITTSKGDKLNTQTTTTGTFDAQVPDNTRIVHFIANQVMTDFPEDLFRNKSEAEVMALLEGSSGRMIYWARFACKNDEANRDKSIAEQMKAEGNSIKMLRNHAKVSVSEPTGNGYFTVKGFAVYNSNAFGTVAPYHPESGFAFTDEEWNNGFVTIPENDAKLSDVTNTTTEMGRYIFECENSADDPVSIILYGRNTGDQQDLYYRVMLINDNGEQILIQRNHDYQLNIGGNLSFGQDTFEEAVKAAATNNVWISISDDVNEVEDDKYILTVAQTNYVIDAENAGKSYTIPYTIKGKNRTQITSSDKAEVTWIDNNVANHGIANIFSVNNGTGEGNITMSLLPMGGNEKLEGTLLVKHGRLQRKIKIIMVKEQSFVPSWVGTQIYGGMNPDDPTQGRSHVTVMFTVPETCPTELFPMNAYISVSGLDIRNASGQKLTVVREGDKEWYSSGDIPGLSESGSEPDYKYLVRVEKPGVQRVYFENILSQTEKYQGHLFIEAEHFATMERVFTYSNDRRSITIEGLTAYKPEGGGNEEHADDELVLYRLVPQKINAPVQFDLQLRNKTGDDISNDKDGQPFNAGAKDEFLLYSQYLDYIVKEGDAGVEYFDCVFYPEKSFEWWQANNPNSGRMQMFKPREEIREQTGDKVGKYSIYMKTNRPKSAEVVRISSNVSGRKPVLDEDKNDVGDNYGGDSYRSVTFELANYNPFRFGARLKHDNGNWNGEEPDRESDPAADVPELVTPLEWTYEPEKEVDIAIDVTSFKGSDNKSVNPFGSEFEIYIDAPMLEIDETRLAENKLNGTKLKADPNVPGRFVYTVDANRDTERTFGTDDAVNTDATGGVNQNGERKTLPFKTKSIVSAGDIVVFSNQKKVVFYSKTFTVTNKSITGNIQYKDESGALHDVPTNAFVAFERTSNNSRIGAVTIKAGGQYELRLRKEYSFNWISDEVQFHYEYNGKVYHAAYGSLSELFSNTSVVLTLEDEGQAQ